MEFWSHSKTIGLLTDPNVTVHGPMSPGTLLTWTQPAPFSGAVTARSRIGIIVGVNGGQVDVAWNKWIDTRGALKLNDAGDLINQVT